jgi:arylsulfatase A-like enzyme
MSGPFLAIALLALAPAPRSAQDAAAPSRPNIVLFTADTLRREHLGLYGYPRPTSPRLDALAQEAVVFERAFAPMATTYPSHMTMLTGLYPHQHGHTSNRGAVRAPYEPAPGKLTLANALAAAGYRTGGFVSSAVLNERTGIGSGFQTYDGPPPNKPTRTSDETVARALAWLAQGPAEQPFFLWIHVWDTHEPNMPRPESLARFAPDDTLRHWIDQRGLDLGALDGAFNADLSIGERFFLVQQKAAEAKGGGRRAGRPLKLAPGTRLFTVDTPAMAELFSRYDACVNQIDGEVGRLEDALVQRGSWANTAFVFCADHGQALGENTHFGHGTNLQINVAVPLFMRFPPSLGVPAQRSTRLVSLADLLPTLLARLGDAQLAEYARQFRGTDALAPEFARGHVFTAEATEFKRGKKQPFLCGVVTERWKLVPSDGGPAKLYDLAAAGEKADVAAAHPATVKELEVLLAKELATAVLVPEGEEPVSPEQGELLDGLGALGYGGDDDDD